MKLQLNTNLIPIFSGTYNTIWEIIEFDDDNKEWNIDYDFNDFMKSIITVYQDSKKTVLDGLNVSFITDIDFIGHFSPREYNFKTDQLDLELTINKKAMLKELNKLKDSKEFNKYLRDNFTSYDGFISFTPNNYDDLYKEITTEGQEHDQAISALIRWLASKDIKNIELDIHENWQCNGYGGLDYKIIND